MFLSGHDDAAGLVAHHAADAAPVFHDGRYMAVQIETMDAAELGICKQQTQLGVPDRTLEEAKTGAKSFHRHQPRFCSDVAANRPGDRVVRPSSRSNL